MNNCEGTQVKAKLEMKEEKKYHFAVEDQNAKTKESRKDEYERENVNNIEITDEKTK